jgi:hypothetical protein
MVTILEQLKHLVIIMTNRVEIAIATVTVAAIAATDRALSALFS